LRGGDPLLNARLQQFSFGQSQPQIGYVSEIIGPDDLHDIGPSRFTLGPVSTNRKTHRMRHPPADE
jgi:hypothetical protein